MILYLIYYVLLGCRKVEFFIEYIIDRCPKTHRSIRRKENERYFWTSNWKKAYIIY